MKKIIFIAILFLSINNSSINCSENNNDVLTGNGHELFFYINNISNKAIDAKVLLYDKENVFTHNDIKFNFMTFIIKITKLDHNDLNDKIFTDQLFELVKLFITFDTIITEEDIKLVIDFLNNYNTDQSNYFYNDLINFLKKYLKNDLPIDVTEESLQNSPYAYYP